MLVPVKTVQDRYFNRHPGHHRWRIFAAAGFVRPYLRLGSTSTYACRPDSSCADPIYLQRLRGGGVAQRARRRLLVKAFPSRSSSTNAHACSWGQAMAWSIFPVDVLWINKKRGLQFYDSKPDSIYLNRAASPPQRRSWEAKLVRQALHRQKSPTTNTCLYMDVCKH
jgi:hypothetical protein